MTVENLKLTPFHPVMCGTEGEARFPIDCATACEAAHDGHVFDFVLRNRGVLASPVQSAAPSVYMYSPAQCVFAATFGHAVTKGCFAHAYFGSERVVEDLKTHPGWTAGAIVLERYTFLRASEANGQVVVGIEFETDFSVTKNEVEVFGAKLITA